MMHRLFGLSAVALLSFNAACGTATRPSGGAGGGGSAAIVGQIAASGEAAKLLTAAQTIGCPDVLVSINGVLETIVFDDDCAFAITDVEPLALVEVRVELVDLGLAGTIELSNVTAGELIEILVEPTDVSLTVSVGRRTTPEPSDELPLIIEGNNVSLQLPEGLFDQGLIVEGNNFTLVGEAGLDCDDDSGWTVIAGEVLINGNNATFRNILFAGSVELFGNNAHFINCCFGGELVVFGNNAEFEDHDGDDGNDDNDDNGDDDNDDNENDENEDNGDDDEGGEDDD